MKKNLSKCLSSAVMVFGLCTSTDVFAGKSKMSGKEESHLIRKKVKKLSTESGAPAPEAREESVSNKNSSSDKKEAQSADGRARLSGEQSPSSSHPL